MANPPKTNTVLQAPVPTPPTQKEVPPTQKETEPQGPQTFGDESDRKACSHEMCCPPNYMETEQAIDLEGPKEPVRKYPFTLDPFQKVISLFFLFYFSQLFRFLLLV